LRIRCCLAVLAVVLAADGFMHTRLAYAEEKGLWRRVSNVNKQQASTNSKRTSFETKTGNLPRRGPVSCERAQSAVGDYAFENVEMKSCYGSSYVFQGTRGGKTFTIVMSASSGELLKVEKLQTFSPR
jgi:hypothetical protein